MDGWSVGLALGLPWLAGALWLRLLWREPAPGVWPLALGYGYLLAMLGATLSLRLLDALGLPLSVSGPLLLFALLALMGALQLRRRMVDRTRNAAGAPEEVPAWQRILFVLLLLWIGLRLVGLALEVWWQPLFPWDSWTTWAVRARVWSELHQLAPFVSPQGWLADPEGRAHTIAAWKYPETVSLLALWPALAAGGWNETAANLPWLGCALALGLGFYGQARLWGASPLTSLIFLWLLLSLPLLDSHVALAGYADLWLATTLGFAAMAFLHWVRDGDWRQGMLALMFALTCPFIKQEGLVWLALFVPALLVARLRGRWLLALMVGTLTAGLVAWMTGGLTFNVTGLGVFQFTPTLIQIPALGRFELNYHDSWEAVWRNLFVYDNWHLLAYLLAPATVLGLATALRRGTESWRRTGLAIVLGSLIALFVLFFLTDAYLWAAKSTSINREFLHFVPVILFWMLTLWEGVNYPALKGGACEEPG
jgi:hypothetical protein